jgi:hypothetical protein
VTSVSALKRPSCGRPRALQAGRSVESNRRETHGDCLSPVRRNATVSEHSAAKSAPTEVTVLLLVSSKDGAPETFVNVLFLDAPDGRLFTPAGDRLHTR